MKKLERYDFTTSVKLMEMLETNLSASFRTEMGETMTAASALDIAIRNNLHCDMLVDDKSFRFCDPMVGLLVDSLKKRLTVGMEIVPSSAEDPYPFLESETGLSKSDEIFDLSKVHLVELGMLLNIAVMAGERSRAPGDMWDRGGKLVKNIYWSVHKKIVDMELVAEYIRQIRLTNEMAYISDGELIEKLVDIDQYDEAHTVLSMIIDVKKGTLDKTEFSLDTADIADRFNISLEKEIKVNLVQDRILLPRVDHPYVAKLLENMTKEYNYPANPANNARLGWETARRFLDSTHNEIREAIAKANQ